jgi:hypothetical protein
VKVKHQPYFLQACFRSLSSGLFDSHRARISAVFPSDSTWFEAAKAKMESVTSCSTELQPDAFENGRKIEARSYQSITVA